MIDIITMQVDVDADGGGKVTTWTKCYSAEDIDDVILWLGLAREVMVQWRDIRVRRQAAATVTLVKPPPRPQPSVPFKKG